MEDYVGTPWKILLMNQIAYKNYMDYIKKLGVSPDSALIEYFNSEYSKVLKMKDVEIIDKVVLNLLFDSLDYHSKLKEIIFSGAGLTTQNVSRLFQVLTATKIKLEVLSLDDNSLGSEAAPIIGEYLASEASFSIRRLSLRHNPLGDSGMQELCERISSRVSAMGKGNHISLPFYELDLEGVRMSDQGMFSLIGLLERIKSKIGEKGFEDLPSLMKLNLANNLFTDNSLKAFSRLLGTYPGIQEINLSYNHRISSDSFCMLINELKQNYSLEHLYYHGNDIDLKGLKAFVISIADNPALRIIKFNFKRDHLSLLMQKEEMMMRYFTINY